MPKVPSLLTQNRLCYGSQAAIENDEQADIVGPRDTAELRRVFQN